MEHFLQTHNWEATFTAISLLIDIYELLRKHYKKKAN